MDGQRGMAVGGLVSAAAATAGFLSTAAGGLLAIRRLGSGFAVAPGPAVILIVCAAGLLIVWVVDRARQAGGAVLPTLLARLGLALGAAAVALPTRSSTPATLACSAVALAAVATLSLTPLLRRTMAAARARGMVVRAPRPLSGSAATPGVPDRAARAADAGEVPATAAPSALGDLFQRFERRGLAGGGERIEGLVRVTVPRGARLGWAHVGFCPPFPATPSVDVSTGYDEIEAIVAAAEVLPWGARVEVRLDEPAEETLDVPVEFAAGTRCDPGDAWHAGPDTPGRRSSPTG